MWKKFDKHKPKEKGWYLCTVEVPHQQRYTMELYWYPNTQRFKDNIRQHMLDTYNVFDYKGDRLHTINLCDRTDSVVAWRKNPKAYMKGFIKEVR